MRPRHVLALATTALAAVLTVAPVPEGVVEELYSRRVYLAFQPWLTGASNRAPFALLDLLIAGAAAWWIAGAVGAVARHGSAHIGRALRDIAVRSVVASAALYADLSGDLGPELPARAACRKVARRHERRLVGCRPASGR